jgi:transcriptional regulator with XRE-family HTH domain
MSKPRRPSDQMMAVGQRLRVTREALGMTQAELAAELNISASAITNWEAGIRLADVLAMGRLVERFGVTLDWIYLGDMSGLRHSLATKLRDPVLSSSRSG